MSCGCLWHLGVAQLLVCAICYKDWVILFVCQSSDYSIKHDSVSDRNVNMKMAQKSSLNYLVHLIRENNDAFVDSHFLKAASGGKCSVYLFSKKHVVAPGFASAWKLLRLGRELQSKPLHHSVWGSQKDVNSYRASYGPEVNLSHSICKQV